MALRTFGKNPPKEKVNNSPNYKNGSFENLNPTEVTLKDTTMLKMLKEYRNRPKNTAPAKPIPYIKTDLNNLEADKPTIVWFGHSSYLIKSKDLNILVDPVFNGYASPFPFFAKAFKGADEYGITDFDTIDVLVITHDHYDHLDYPTIKALHPKVKYIITSLGVGNHLNYWGVPKEKITELDWWEKKELNNGLKFTAAPARHFSGRSFRRGQTLWSSFVLNIHEHQIYIGADSGYDMHFKTIGEKFGGFDFALLECGQYGKNWPYIHMMPEQTLQAAKDINTKVLMPVHWAKFTLALHPWNEPINRLMAVKDDFNGTVTTPKIGEPVIIGEHLPNKIWWEI
jgi:L-ascorbate metabolism protein UlaG (beta-lactamase superfamily)